MVIITILICSLALQESDGDGVWDDMEGLRSNAEVMAVVEAKGARTLLVGLSEQRAMEVRESPGGKRLS